MNKFTFVNSEHGNVLKVAGTLPDDTPNLDLDAVKDTKKILPLRQRDNDGGGATIS